MANMPLEIWYFYGLKPLGRHLEAPRTMHQGAAYYQLIKSWFKSKNSKFHQMLDTYRVHNNHLSLSSILSEKSTLGQLIIFCVE